MEEVLNETKTLYNNILPYLIASKIINPLLGISFIPILIILKTFLLELYKYITKQKNDVIKISYKIYNDDNDNDNIYNRDLYFSILKKVISNCKNIEGIAYKSYNDKNKIIIDYNGDVNTTFNYENNIIKIKTSCITDKNYKSKILELIGDKDVLNKFISESYKQSIDTEIKSYNISYGDWKKNTIHNCKSFDNLFLNKNIKSSIIKTIDNFNNSHQLCKKLGIPHKLGFMFYGTPGCGKSSTVYAIAQYLHRNIYHINLNLYESVNKFMTDISKIENNSVVVFNDIDTMITKRKEPMNIDKIIDSITLDNLSTKFNADYVENVIIYLIENNNDIDKDLLNKLINNYELLPEFYNKYILKKNKHVIEAMKKEIIFYHDGIDYFGEKHGYESTDNEKALEMNDLLHVLDGYEYFNNCIIVFTTNFPNKLDDALIRAGRIDHKIEFIPAKFDEINDVFKYVYNESLIDIVDKNTLDKLMNIKIKQSELINCVIFPNIDNINMAIDKLLTYY